MRKIESFISAYPQTLECEGGKANRVYTFLPMCWEVAHLAKHLNLPSAKECGEAALNSLIISIYEDDSGALYWAFGCVFFDKKAENEKIFKIEMNMLDLVNKVARNFDAEGLRFKRNYYFKNFLSIRKRLKSVEVI